MSIKISQLARKFSKVTLGQTNVPSPKEMWNVSKQRWDALAPGFNWNSVPVGSIMKVTTEGEAGYHRKTGPTQWDPMDAADAPVASLDTPKPHKAPGRAVDPATKNTNAARSVLQWFRNQDASRKGLSDEATIEAIKAALGLGAATAELPSLPAPASASATSNTVNQTTASRK